MIYKTDDEYTCNREFGLVLAFTYYTKGFFYLTASMCVLKNQYDTFGVTLEFIIFIIN